MITKTLKLVLTLSVLFFIGCSLEQDINESSETLNKKFDEVTNTIELTEVMKVMTQEVNSQNNSSQKGPGSSAGEGNLVYYRVSFYSTVSPFNENAVNLGFQNTAFFATSLYLTSEAHTYIWIFFEDEQTTIDNYIANNTVHIEESLEPTVFKITYDTSLTTLDKNTIKGEFDFLISPSYGLNNETWVYRDCCVNGDPCDRFADPFYAYYGLVSEEVLQW